MRMKPTFFILAWLTFNFANAQTKNIFKSDGNSSFTIKSFDKEQGYFYEQTETNYKTRLNLKLPSLDYQPYFAKVISHKTSCTSCEKTQGKVELQIMRFKDPTIPIFSTTKLCDEIILEHNYFKAVTVGCCADPGSTSVFDYNDRLILSATGQVIYGYIPNSDISFHIGYLMNADNANSGKLYLAYSPDDIYEIRIENKSYIDELCSPTGPFVSIESDDEQDDFDRDSQIFSLWSADKSIDQNKLNFTIILNFDCEEEVDNTEIRIPIVKGKPYGSAKRIVVVRDEIK